MKRMRYVKRDTRAHGKELQTAEVWTVKEKNRRGERKKGREEGTEEENKRGEEKVLDL